MPVNLLPHITGLQPGESMRRIAPGIEAASLISEFILVPAVLISAHSKALSDGVPTLVFCAKREGEVTFQKEDEKYTVNAAWCCSPYLENADLKVKHIGAYLLVTRFHASALTMLCPALKDQLQYRQCCSLPDALGKEGLHLLDKVFASDSINDRIAAIEEVATGCLAIQNSSTNYLLNKAVDALKETKGMLSIERWAHVLKLDYKWLERNFKKHMGVTPKEYARIQRFLHAYQALTTRSDKNLLSIALDHGYHDQHHFAKECKRLIGQPPLRYLESLTA